MCAADVSDSEKVVCAHASAFFVHMGTEQLGIEWPSGRGGFWPRLTCTQLRVLFKSVPRTENISPERAGPPSGRCPRGHPYCNRFARAGRPASSARQRACPRGQARRPAAARAGRPRSTAARAGTPIAIGLPARFRTGTIATDLLARGPEAWTCPDLPRLARICPDLLGFRA